MTTIRRIPRPFLSTGLAFGTLAGVTSLCTTSLMAASHPAAQAATQMVLAITS